jgi:phospholipid N-methyltransferase
MNIKVLLALPLLLSSCADESSVFLREFIKNPQDVGAIAPSSKELAQAMADSIEEEDAYILELGGGMGSFTQKLVDKTSTDKLFVVEKNEIFFQELKKKFPQANLLMVDAGSLENHIPEHAMGKIKYVVSSLPFGLLPSTVSQSILNSLKKVCAPDATFIQCTYLAKDPIPKEICKLFPVTPKLSKTIDNNFPAADIWVYSPRKTDS